MDNTQLPADHHNAPLDVSDGIVEYLKGELKTVQAKCDRYEAALKEIRTGKVLPHLIAKMALEKNDNEALSAEEGEKLGLPHLAEPILNDEDLKAWEQKQKGDKQ